MPLEFDFKLIPEPNGELVANLKHVKVNDVQVDQVVEDMSVGDYGRFIVRFQNTEWAKLLGFEGNYYKDDSSLNGFSLYYQ